jgi:hypothetical protein
MHLSVIIHHSPAQVEGVALSLTLILTLACCSPPPPETTSVEKVSPTLTTRTLIEIPFKEFNRPKICAISPDGQTVLLCDQMAYKVYLNSRPLPGRWCPGADSHSYEVAHTPDLRTVAYPTCEDGIAIYGEIHPGLVNVGRPAQVQLSSDGRVAAYLAMGQRRELPTDAVFLNSQRVSDWTDYPVIVRLSQDGSTVAYSFFEGDSGGAVFVNGKRISRFFTYEILDMWLTEDGRSVIYKAMDSRQAVFRDREQVSAWHDTIGQVAATPDGMTIAYAAGREESQWVFRNKDLVTGEAFPEIKDIDISSDGRTIVYAARKDYKWALFRNSERITEWRDDISDVTVSSDGSAVAYAVLYARTPAEQLSNTLCVEEKEIHDWGVTKLFYSALKHGDGVAGLVSSSHPNMYDRDAFKRQKRLLFTYVTYPEGRLRITVYEYIAGR